jgi:hypothetical protein
MGKRLHISSHEKATNLGRYAYFAQAIRASKHLRFRSISLDRNICANVVLRQAATAAGRTPSKRLPHAASYRKNTRSLVTTLIRPDFNVAYTNHSKKMQKEFRGYS